MDLEDIKDLFFDALERKSWKLKFAFLLILSIIAVLIVWLI